VAEGDAREHLPREALEHGGPQPLAFLQHAVHELRGGVKEGVSEGERMRMRLQSGDGLTCFRS